MATNIATRARGAMAAVLQEPEATTSPPDVAEDLVRQLGAQQEQIRGLELQVADALSKVDAMSKVDALNGERRSTSSTVLPSDAESSLEDNALERLEEGNKEKAGFLLAITPARLDAGDSHALNMSIWDSMLFFGLPGIGGSVSAVIFLAYVFNFLVQLAFCFLITTHMLEPDVNSNALDTLLKFRLSIAHDVEFADPMTKQSLAQQVCNSDEKVHYAAGQIAILEDVKRFLNGGPALMILAEIIFLCVIVKELDAIAQFTKAIMSLRRSHSTRVVLADSSEHAVPDPAERCKAEDLYLIPAVTRIEKIQPQRVYFAWALVIVPRMFISLFLGITGVRFIGKTNNVDDLILNCLAIAFVIDLDELIYECFAPRRLKTLMSNVEPIPLLAPEYQVPAPCLAPEYQVARRHVPVLSLVLKVLFLIASVSAAYYLYLARFFWQLEQVDHILCSQDSHLDFVYARNSANDVIYVARSRETDDWTAGQVTIMEVANLAIEPRHDWNPGILARQQELRGDGEESPPAIVIGHSAALVGDTTFKAIHYEALEELGDSPLERAAGGLVCRDLGSRSEARSYRAALRELMKDTSISDCTDVPWQYCTRREMTQLRALCPQYCNCHVPPTYKIDDRKALAGYFQSPRGGCPKSCQPQVETSNEVRFVNGPSPLSDDAALCTDLGPDAIVFGGLGGLKSSVDCLDNGTVAADCAGLPPESFWWLTFTAGLFEHLAANIAFRDIVEHTVPLEFPDLPSGMRRELVEWISTGSLARSFLDGSWELMPGLRHPRGLTGCDYLTSFEVRKLLNTDLCSAEEYSSIRFMCPVSCGCSPAKLWQSNVSDDGGVTVEQRQDLHQVTNRIQDLGSCPAACILVHPKISGDPSYDSIHVSGEDYCESGTLSAVECERSSCCQWDPDGSAAGVPGRCWSSIGASCCDDTASGASACSDTASAPGTGGSNSGSSLDESHDVCTDLGPETAADSQGNTCEDYASEFWPCSNYYDDTDFTVADMCCWCGGGEHRHA